VEEDEVDVSVFKSSGYVRMLSYRQALKQWNQTGATQGKRVSLGGVYAMPRKGSEEQKEVIGLRQPREEPREEAPVQEEKRQMVERVPSRLESVPGFNNVRMRALDAFNDEYTEKEYNALVAILRDKSYAVPSWGLDIAHRKLDKILSIKADYEKDPVEKPVPEYLEAKARFDAFQIPAYMKRRYNIWKRKQAKKE
jgi:hypothetical protein